MDFVNEFWVDTAFGGLLLNVSASGFYDLGKLLYEKCKSKIQKEKILRNFNEEFREEFRHSFSSDGEYNEFEEYLDVICIDEELRFIVIDCFKRYFRYYFEGVTALPEGMIIENNSNVEAVFTEFYTQRFGESYHKGVYAEDHFHSFFESLFRFISSWKRHKLPDDLKSLFDLINLEFNSQNTDLNEIKDKVNLLIRKNKPSENQSLLLTAQPPRADIFFGREVELENVRDKLKRGQSCLLISGIGGIGKTTIARELFHDFLKNKNYSKMAWIEYNSNSTSDTARSTFLDQLSITLRINELENVDDVLTRKRIIVDWLNNLDNNTFLVIDNVDVTPDADSDLDLLRHIECNLLVTSRIEGLFRGNITPVIVGFLNEDECVEVFYGSYTRDENRDKIEIVRNIVQLVQCHTLSVELLALTAEETAESLEKFYNNIVNIGFTYADIPVTASGDSDVKMHKMAERLALLYSLERLNNRKLATILKTISILPSFSLKEELPDWLGISREIMAKLAKLGWFKITDEGYYMQPVIRICIELQMKDKPLKLEDCRSIIDAIQNCNEYGDSNFIKADVGYEEKYILLKVASAIADYFIEENSAEYTTLLSYVALFYKENGDYDNSLRYRIKDLDKREKLFGTKDVNTAESYNNIGLLYYVMGNNTKALKYLEKALSIFEKDLGNWHLNTISCYNGIAGVYEDKGDYNKALEYDKKTLKIRERILGLAHPLTAASYNNIGNIYNAKGDYDTALEYHLKSLSIKEKALGNHHPDTATSYNNIGWLYQNSGDFNKALEYYQKCIVVREKVQGKFHPDTATSYTNIGWLYECMGNHTKALYYLFDALAIEEKLLGSLHPRTAKCYNSIGGVYANQGDNYKALEYCLKALDSMKTVLGISNPITAQCYNNIGLIYQNLGDYDHALDYLKIALQVQDKILSAKHPHTIMSIRIIYSAYSKSGKPYKEFLSLLSGIDPELLKQIPNGV